MHGEQVNVKAFDLRWPKMAEKQLSVKLRMASQHPYLTSTPLISLDYSYN